MDTVIVDTVIVVGVVVGLLAALVEYLTRTPIVTPEEHDHDKA